MKFAAFALAGSSAVEEPDVIFRRMVEFAQEAEELGYDSVWFAEHHFSNYGYIPNPLLMATRVAGETSKIKVGTAVLVLPFWDPLRVAEDIALTDQLTNGRLEVGVARGYQPFEFRRFGLDQEESRARTEESVAIITKALSGESFEFEGKYHQIPWTTLYPRPLQQPRPPIWLAAATEESFDLGAAFADDAVGAAAERAGGDLGEFRAVARAVSGGASGVWDAGAGGGDADGRGGAGADGALSVPVASGDEPAARSGACGVRGVRAAGVRGGAES